MKLNKEEIEKIRSLIDDMFWDYDRMSSSGQETLNKLAKLFGLRGITNMEEQE